jgi:hypothetical protein
MGDNFTDGRMRLFPGLLAILLSLAALLLRPTRSQSANASPVPDLNASNETRARWVQRLDVIAVVALALSVPAIGYDRTGALHGVYKYFTSEVPLALLSLALITRFCLAYPAFLRRGENTNFIQTLRSEQRSDAFWLGLAWAIIGFCYSLGWNFFFYRILYDVIPLFRSMRVVVRGSMIAYLGIAILAGLGARRLVEILREKRPRLREGVIFAVIAVMLLLEFNAAPLAFMRGDVFADGVTVRLKETPMHGGVVVLPANEHVNHRHVLRSADHTKPLIVGISGFSSWYETQIEIAIASGPIPPGFMRFLEDVPTSYVVVENNLIEPQRRVDYEAFVVSAVMSGRLRFINRFDGRDDLYAVVKNEPQAKAEAELPFALKTREWDDLIKEDSVNMLGQYRTAGQALYRFYVASYGQMPRYTEFLSDAQVIGRGVIVGSFDGESKLESSLGAFAREWVERKKFTARYKQLTDERFVDELAANAGIALEPAGRSGFIDKLTSKTMTRADVLVALVNNQQFVDREANRSLVLLHYFGYLHRNPDDPPDKDLTGFNFWLKEIEISGDVGRLARGFMASGENKTDQK